MKKNNQSNLGLRTWVEVSRGALKNNYAVFRKLAGSKKLMAVVKSNAYGHDLGQAAKFFESLGAEWLAADSVVEARALREQGLQIPILVLGYTLPANFALAAQLGITLTISTWENLKMLERAPVEWHLKLDTGMHRQGFLPEEWSKLFAWLEAHPQAAQKMTGVYTHFAAAKNPAFPAETRAQTNLFAQALAELKKLGYSPLAHAAASSGTLLFNESHFDMLRAGIGLYGLWPSAEARGARATEHRLLPALTWKTIISEIKKLPAGARVGYDLTETLPRPTRLAVCPVGYWHGYPRALSSIAHALVDGKKCKVLGRVSMDMLCVDVTGVKNARVGSEVVLLGQQNKEVISAEELGLLAGTINYEIVTRLNPLMRRIYL
jgi:alanine racemase